jgi:hypothetical protein
MLSRGAAMWGDVWFLIKCVAVLFAFCYLLLWVDDLEKRWEKRKRERETEDHARRDRNPRG